MTSRALFEDQARLIFVQDSRVAARIFNTVVPAYCLVDSGVQLPGTAQDVRDATQWVVNNLPFSDSDIYILGHSVGQTNVFTTLALPELNSSALHPRINGASSSQPYASEDIPMIPYHGEDAEEPQTVSLVLLESARLLAPRLLLDRQEGIPL